MATCFRLPRCSAVCKMVHTGRGTSTHATLFGLITLLLLLPESCFLSGLRQLPACNNEFSSPSTSLSRPFVGVSALTAPGATVGSKRSLCGGVWVPSALPRAVAVGHAAPDSIPSFYRWRPSPGIDPATRHTGVSRRKDRYAAEETIARFLRSPPREESASIALAFAESSRGRGERACQPSGTILTYDGSNDGQGVRITGSHSLAALRSSSSASASKLASSTGSQWILGLRGGFNLQVKTMSGKTVVLDNVNASDSILDIKRRVEQREGIPVDQQRLVFNGKQLENGKTVQDYDLSENSVLHLVLRLRGGGNAKDAAVNN